MGSRYLTDMANVLRRAGLNVTEVNGWQTRARGSGGYNGNPQAIMVHHTAGRAGASSSSEVQYMTYGSPDAPLANLYVGRAGDVWVMAAGATNTNGKGGPLGPIPKDGMNSRAIGIEIGNNGVGEPYPQAQQDATIKTVQTLSQTYGVPAAQVYAHFEWAPTRKIDPSGPSRWSNNQNAKWDMNRFRNDVGSSGPPPPTPPPTTPPTTGDEDVLVNLVQYKNPGYPNPQPAVFAQYSGGYKIWIRSEDVLKILKATSGIHTVAQFDDDWFEACGPILPGTPLPYDCDAYGRKKF